MLAKINALLAKTIRYPYIFGARTETGPAGQTGKLGFPELLSSVTSARTSTALPNITCFFMFEEAKRLKSYARPMVFSFDLMIWNISVSEWAVMLTLFTSVYKASSPLGAPDFC